MKEFVLPPSKDPRKLDFWNKKYPNNTPEQNEALRQQFLSKYKPRK